MVSSYMFPPTRSTLLSISDQVQNPRPVLCRRRVADICATQDVQPHLFKGLPAPSHIRQGKSLPAEQPGLNMASAGCNRNPYPSICAGLLGDCWLLCALACLSCKPGALERCFSQREVSREGCYTVRLFDSRQNRWTKVVIDDWCASPLVARLTESTGCKDSCKSYSAGPCRCETSQPTVMHRQKRH